jgi:hypothetical protein
VFLREKFYWLALLFPALWLLWHRLWLGLLGWFFAVMALGTLAYALGLGQQVAAFIAWLPSIVLAFEGSELRRRKLLRAGYRDAGTVVGADLEDAERRFFADWATGRVERREPRINATVAQSPLTPAPVSTAAANPVIGLFPQPGGGR